MAKFDVSAQRYRNAAVYIEAITEDEAKELAWKKVGEMLQKACFGAKDIMSSRVLSSPLKYAK